jgi:hypothetical protein
LSSVHASSLSVLLRDCVDDAAIPVEFVKSAKCPGS